MDSYPELILDVDRARRLYFYDMVLESKTNPRKVGIQPNQVFDKARLDRTEQRLGRRQLAVGRFYELCYFWVVCDIEIVEFRQTTLLERWV